MPSKRKRIGYLPLLNIHQIIINIASKEKISQSKVVGILIEEALIARGLFHHQNKNNSMGNVIYKNQSNINDSQLRDNDFDELISDKGITYSTKEYKNKSEYISSEQKETFDEELFEQFKQFILFKKMLEEK